MPVRMPPLAIVLALALGGCAATGGPATYNATFPAETSRAIDPIAVSFIDQTGLVTAMSLAPAGVGAARVAPEPGDTNALRIEWPGSNCDGRISLVMANTGDSYTVTIHINPSVAGGFGCTAEQVLRAVTIHVREPLDPARFTIEQVYP